MPQTTSYLHLSTNTSLSAGFKKAPAAQMRDSFRRTSALAAVRASAQSINVSITLVTTGPIPADQNLPLPYTLNCTAMSTPGSPTNVTWITPPAGMMGPLTTSGSTSSRILTLSSPVLLSYAGLYVCNASANGMSRTASYAFNVSVRTSPLPPVTVTSTPSSTKYQGSMLTLMCSFGITSPNLGLTSIKWVGPAGLPLVPDGRVSILTYSSNTTSTLYTSNLTISSLSRKDGGLYTCTPAIGPKPPSPYVIDFTQETSSPSVTINDLTLGVAVSPTNLRSSSNSSFQINCTATKPPSVLPFVFSWSWKDSYTGSVLTFNSSDVTTIGGTTFVMTQPPGVTNSTPTVTSTLIVSQPLPGVYSYRCDVMVSVPIDGPVSWNGSIYVAKITGPPRQPMKTRGNKISMDSLTIQWMVPFIAYTRETYVVRYGSAPDNLNQSSILVNGSANLNVTGAQFGVNLTGLVPYSLYYYTIVASNTEGTTTTPVMTLSFFPPDGVTSLLVGSGDLTHLHVTWSPPPPPNNDIINYRVMTTPFGGGGSSTIIVSDLYVNLTGTYAPGVPYNVSVTGYNVFGYGKTTTAYGYIQELAPSGLLSVKTTPINGSTILVSWNPLSPVEARGYVRYYLVTWTPSSSKARGTAGSANLTADATMFLITGLDPMVSYTISVSAGTSAGVGALKTVVVDTGMQAAEQLCGDLCRALLICLVLVVMAIVVASLVAVMYLHLARRKKHGEQEITSSPHHYDDVHELSKIGVYVDVDIASAKLEQRHKYIMIQEPVTPSVRDFWKLVWQQKVNTIVMLTQCNEGGKSWPESVGGAIEPLLGLKVTLEEATPFADHVTRKMKVEMAGSAPLRVSHYQYEGWPDTGVPSSATSLTDFARHVHRGRGPPGPPLVVCSCHGNSGGLEAVITSVCVAGVAERMGDVGECPCHSDPYSVLIHKAIDELTYQSSVSEADLGTRITELHRFNHRDNGTSLKGSGFAQQFQALPLRFTLPFAEIGVFQGYKVCNAYIAAQAPLQDTVKDFWRMVWEFKCKVIVVLFRLDEGVEQFWPSEQGHLQSNIGTFSVNLDEIHTSGNCSVCMLEMKDDQGNCHKVTLVHYTDWLKDDRAQSGDDIKSIICLPDLQATSTASPIVVVCSDGVGRTGAFITIHAMMEKLKTEHVVDFFQFIKSSRTRRPNFVSNVEQYIFCYECV
eukprot:Em0011g1150a